MDQNDRDIQLTGKDGAIVLRESDEPEIYAPIDVGEASDNIRFSIAFFLYATERIEWVQEFTNFVGTLKDPTEEASAEHRRSTFEVINGDKE